MQAIAMPLGYLQYATLTSNLLVQIKITGGAY